MDSEQQDSTALPIINNNMENTYNDLLFEQTASAHSQTFALG